MRGICSLPRRIMRNRTGAVAMEFALVAPMMFTLLTGIAELSNYMMAVRRVSACAEAVSDLIARATEISDADLSDIYQGARYLIEPFDENNMTIAVVSVRYDDDGVAYEDWSSNWNSGSISNATTQASGLGLAGESVIIASISFTYTPLLNAVISSSFSISDIAVTRPRLVDYVEYR